MPTDETHERLMEYLYGEMSPSERQAFKKELEGQAEIRGDLRNYLQLRELLHEHLPEQKVPPGLTRKVLAELGIRRPWYESFTQVLVRPAFAGALVLALTLGVAYQVRQWKSAPEPIAALEETVPLEYPAVRPAHAERELKFSDLFLANQPLQPDLRAPARRSYPGFASDGGGLVSLASYGNPSRLQASSGISGADIQNLDEHADEAVATFVHKQALRMRAMGEYMGAAGHLAKLIKAYPNYPLKLEALAQRIDCLFKAGENDLARKELAWLRTFSPNLAYLVESRWGN